jgi:hypothetical protein
LALMLSLATLQCVAEKNICRSTPFLHEIFREGLTLPLSWCVRFPRASVDHAHVWQ